MKRVIQTMSLLSALCGTAFAQESLPAVSGANGKLDYSGGWMESDEGHNVSGSFSVPITSHFGFQADGLYTRVSERDFWGGAGHFFWRDPNVGLIGISGGDVFTESVLNSYQATVEGEYYFERFTVGAIAGVGHISYDVRVPFISTEPTRFVGTLSLDWYVIDNFRLGASYSYLFNNHLGQVDVEYQIPWKGLALTAEYARGEYDYDHALFGARFYFGKNKSLKDRHRQDDPRGATQRIRTAIGLYGAEFNRKAEDYWRKFVAANPETTFPGEPLGTWVNLGIGSPPWVRNRRTYHGDFNGPEGRMADPSTYPPGPPDPISPSGPYSNP